MMAAGAFLVAAAQALTFSSFLFSSPASAQLTKTVFTALKIVLIGDSSAAGNGARDARVTVTTSLVTASYRSPTNWAGLYRKCLQDEDEKRAITYINDACSGARLKYILNKGKGKNGQLLDSIGQDTDLVLVSASINDPGFFDMLMQCFYLKDPQDCSRLIAEASGNLSNVKAMFVELFREI